jgi:hypothetical protein
MQEVVILPQNAKSRVKTRRIAKTENHANPLETQGFESQSARAGPGFPSWTSRVRIPSPAFQ